MSEHHPTAPAAADKAAKPNKPYPDFPLSPHAAGVWAKKIRGKMHYFGPWADPDGALKKYLAQKDDLHAGREPREATEGATLKEVCNAFLSAKQAAVGYDELSPCQRSRKRSSARKIAKRAGVVRSVSLRWTTNHLQIAPHRTADRAERPRLVAAPLQRQERVRRATVQTRMAMGRSTPAPPA